MLVLVGAFLVSLLPTIALFLWLRKQNGDNEEYRGTCNDAMKEGLLSVLWVTLTCAFFAVTQTLLKISRLGPVWEEAYRTFIVVVLPEEAVKMFLLSRFLKKTDYKYSWRDIVAFQIIINLGFSLPEDLLYALSTTPIHMLVRGVFMMHGGYGFVMGYFFGKARVTGKRMYYVPALMIPYVLHGLYDFALDDMVLELSDVFYVIPVLMVVVDVVFLILMFIFFRKTKNQELYTAPVEN